MHERAVAAAPQREIIGLNPPPARSQVPVTTDAEQEPERAHRTRDPQQRSRLLPLEFFHERHPEPPCAR